MLAQFSTHWSSVPDGTDATGLVDSTKACWGLSRTAGPDNLHPSAGHMTRLEPKKPEP